MEGNLDSVLYEQDASPSTNISSLYAVGRKIGNKELMVKGNVLVDSSAPQPIILLTTIAKPFQ